MHINPDLDLVIERELRAPPALVWRCWTEPALFCQWYAPKPWVVDEVVMQLHPGGRFYLVMAGPDGQRFPNEGSILLADPERKLVFTDLMTQGFAPVPAVNPDFGPAFTAVMTFAPMGSGTLYRAVARHSSTSDAKINLTMGFQDGWAVTAAQLDTLSQGLMP